MAFDEPEETQLIDVTHAVEESPLDSEATEIQRQPPDEATPPPAKRPGRRAARSTPVAHDADSALVETRIATVGERFAAFLLDVGFLGLIYWASVQIYHWLWHGHWDGAAPMNLRTQGLLFHAVFLLIVAAYFIATETLLSASPGKLLCRLGIRRLDGQLPNISAVIIRTLLLPTDLLMVGLVMEWSEKHQRLGDIAAGTTVVRRSSSATPIGIGWDQIAKTVGRITAGTINASILIGLTIGYLLLLTPDRPFVSQWLLICYPLLMAIYWASIQRMAQTTPGGWLFGHQIFQENGLPLSFPQALLRTALIPVDLLGIGPLAVALSPRRQRVGDLVAGTLVIRGTRLWQGGMIWLFVLLTMAALFLGAMLNPVRMVSSNLSPNPDFRWSFVPRTDLLPNFPPSEESSVPFGIQGFRFAEGRKENIRSPATYVPGETAYFVFEVHGFRTAQFQVWVQEDLTVRYPDGTFGLKQENIIDYKTIKRERGPLEFTNQIYLPPGIPTGEHTVYISLRDKLAPGTPPRVYTHSFFVKESAANRPATPEGVAPVTPGPTERAPHSP